MLAGTEHQIPVLHAIILGIVQGLSEFLPISSSGHLILVPWLFGWEELSDPASADLNRTFDVALHVGTFLAAVLYFRRDLLRLVTAGLRAIKRRKIADRDERLAGLLLISAVPAGAVGAVLDSVMGDSLAQIPLVGTMLIVFGVVLLIVDRRCPQERLVDDFSLRDAVVMGVSQAVSLSPGVSRSGVTISAGRWLGFQRDDAARLSFLMSIPIIGGAAMFKGAKVVADGGLPPGAASAFIWGIIASTVTGAAAVWLVLRVVRSGSYLPFVAYRVALGAGVLVLAVAQFRAG